MQQKNLDSKLRDESKSTAHRLVALKFALLHLPPPPADSSSCFCAHRFFSGLKEVQSRSVTCGPGFKPRPAPLGPRVAETKNLKTASSTSSQQKGSRLSEDRLKTLSV